MCILNVVYCTLQIIIVKLSVLMKQAVLCRRRFPMLTHDVFVQSDVRARTNVPHQVYLIKCVTIIWHFLVITHVSGGLVVVVVFLLVLTTLQSGHQVMSACKTCLPGNSDEV